ncbi:MAG: metallophosphoesterase [Methanomassiliicoccales archaeon]|nr:MAG: metallophosphoesterase [Methanomassiliicoccales archaeon]
MRIAHISDLHITQANEFKEKTFEKGRIAVNSLEPSADLVFISGDISYEGILPEYELAREKIKEFKGTTMLIPGNHDARHMGFQLFEEFFGRLEFYKRVGDVGIIGLDSTEPDKDEGHIGRDKYGWIEQNLKNPDKITIVGLHHHLVPVPNSGREQNIIIDAGGVLDLVLKNEVTLILMGHRHVPHAVRVHNTLMLNAGTFSSARTRAHLGNSFNIIDMQNKSITVTAYDIEKSKEKVMVEFDSDKDMYINRYYPQ